MRPSRHIFLSVLLLGLSSCTQIREAQMVVAEADSLRAEGVQYDDSAAMARAATTLDRVRLICPTAYAHASYYYGRILREHGNPPEAMLAFLRVVHSHTKDHAVKARAYSNMGTLCYLADEYALSYEMYRLSAERFLLAKDSIAYFYSLNNMAYDLAEQGDKQGVYDLLEKVESQCTNEDVLVKILETKAEACMKANDNDSALYYSTRLWERGNHEPTGLLIRAQAYDNLGEKDSALQYAHLVLESTTFYGDKFNALYIITHNDTSINVEELLALTSARTDIQMEYTDARSLLSQAVQLLRQDLNRRPDFTWLWTIIFTALVLVIPSALYTFHKHRKIQLLSQQIEEARAAHQKRVNDEIERLCRTVTDVSSLKKTLCWGDFNKMCEVVNNRMFGLADKLKALAALNEKEFRLCVLVALGTFHDKEMADILCYGDKSIRSIKRNVAQKLGTSSRHLRTFLLRLAN